MEAKTEDRQKVPHRAAGVLAPLFSLPSQYGCGDFSADTEDFIGQIAHCGFSSWQILPLTPAGWGNSPYASRSLFAISECYASPERLFESGYINKSALTGAPEFAPGRVEWAKVAHFKGELLTQAARSGRVSKTALDAFREKNSFWIDGWTEFNSKLTGRTPSEEIAVQYLLHEQWRRVHEWAKKCGVAIIGDEPFYPSDASADVVCHPEYFNLSKNGKPALISGAPPDYFSPSGQMWGNPTYRWEECSESGFEFFCQRFSKSLEMFDRVRLDHFLGYHQVWEIPAGSNSAKSGHYRAVPGKELFSAVRGALGGGDIASKFIAEDLGIITPEANEFRMALGFLCTRVIEFAFDGGDDNPHLPHNWSSDTAAYTGTHDNATLCEWARSGGGKIDFAKRYLASGDYGLPWNAINSVLSSVASLAIIPLWDLLFLEKEGRINTPGTVRSANWSWRAPHMPEWEKFAPLIKKYGRS